MTLTTETFPPALVRATLPTGILALLEEGPLHGYGLAQELARRGFGHLKGGSLYPALSKLEEEGAVIRSWAEGDKGPARREYALTPRGRDLLNHQRKQLANLAQALGATPAAPSLQGAHP